MNVSQKKTPSTTKRRVDVLRHGEKMNVSEDFGNFRSLL